MTPFAETNYIVVFDGDVYATTSDDQRNFGNASLRDENAENTGEPFYIYWQQQNNISIYCAEGSHTISIGEVIEIKDSSIIKINGEDVVLKGNDGWIDGYIPVKNIMRD